jgi:hypothetical protein
MYRKMCSGRVLHIFVRLDSEDEVVVWNYCVRGCAFYSCKLSRSHGLILWEGYALMESVPAFGALFHATCWFLLVVWSRL